MILSTLLENAPQIVTMFIGAYFGGYTQSFSAMRRMERDMRALQATHEKCPHAQGNGKGDNG